MGICAWQQPQNSDFGCPPVWGAKLSVEIAHRIPGFHLIFVRE